MFTHDDFFLQFYKSQNIYTREKIDTCTFVEIIFSDISLFHVCFNIYYINLDFFIYSQFFKD